MGRARDRLRMALSTARAGLTALGHVVSRPPGPRVVIAPGDLAPDFALPGSDGRTWRLSDFRGKQAVVLAWFPKAFTPGCTAECRSLQATGPVLDTHGIRQFAISTDDPGTNRLFAASLGLDYPVLSDEDASVGRAYGVVGRTGFASRWTFFIGLDGRIRAIDKAVHSSSHGQAILDRVAELGLGEPREPREPREP